MLKIICANFFIFEKKSRLIDQSKDRKLSVNLGYFRLKHRLHNLPGFLLNMYKKSTILIFQTILLA